MRLLLCGRVGSISGGLALGLAELPASIDVALEFELPSLPAPEGTRRPFVTAASISLGDASWDEQDIQFFQLGFDATGTLNALTYFTGLIDTASVLMGLTLNFPLTVSGTDIASGLDFSYSCPESEQTITERGATPIPVQLDVSYSVCEVLSGPLSLGLTELPATIDASFQFSLDRLPPPLGEQEPQVTSASLSVGDAAWDENDLQNFQLIFGAAGALTGLTYDMLGIDTGTTLGLIIFNNNFALTVEGTDIASGNSFEYFCPESAQTITEREVSYSSGPLVGCLAPGGSGKSQLQIKDQDADGPGSKDKIQWKWLKGPALSQADFGDPVDPNGPDFKLCIYAGATPSVIVEMQVPSGGTCGTKACWKPISTKGYKYGDKGLSSDGVKKLLLKGDVAGKSKILIQGKDGNLPLPTLPLDPNGPVIAQLSSSDPNLPCYEETFPQANVTKNEAKQFKAKTP